MFPSYIPSPSWAKAWQWVISFIIAPSGLMDSLEQTKKANAATNEAFKDDIVAQAMIEEYVLKLFAYADAEDRAERFNKNVIKVSGIMERWLFLTMSKNCGQNFGGCDG